MNNKLLIRKYDTPINLFILGDANHDLQKPTFALTDDECTLDIVRGKSRICMTTYGFVFILTPEEVAQSIDFMEYDSGADGIYLEDFEGSIYIVIEGAKEEVEFKDDVDLEDYLYWQTKHSMDDIDLEISLVIEDTSNWRNRFHYQSFPVHMLSNLVKATKEI